MPGDVPYGYELDESKGLTWPSSADFDLASRGRAQIELNRVELVIERNRIDELAFAAGDGPVKVVEFVFEENIRRVPGPPPRNEATRGPDR